jgi:hypothetical protein
MAADFDESAHARDEAGKFSGGGGGGAVSKGPASPRNPPGKKEPASALSAKANANKGDHATKATQHRDAASAHKAEASDARAAAEKETDGGKKGELLKSAENHDKAAASHLAAARSHEAIAKVDKEAKESAESTKSGGKAAFAKRVAGALGEKAWVSKGPSGPEALAKELSRLHDEDEAYESMTKGGGPKAWKK